MPRVFIVKTHGNLGVDETSVRALLGELEYTIIDRAIEDESKSITVLTAVRDDPTDTEDDG